MDNKRTQAQQDLFQNRSTTREFLFSKPRAPLTEVDIVEFPPDASADSIQSRPDLLTGKALIDAAMDRLSLEAKFSAMVVRIDTPNPVKDEKHSDETSSDIQTVVADAIEKVCIKGRDVWGRLNAAEFACFLPAEDDISTTARADRLKQKIPTGHSQTVSVGIASYPTLTYERHHILDNAHKALRHASFFGSDSLVCFDSISLNISGDDFYQMGDIKGAVKEFKMALLLDDANVNVYNSLGVCYGVLNQFDKALEKFKFAISLDPEEVMALYNAGLICTLTGNNQQALEYFLKADRVCRDIFEVAFHLGKLYLETKKPQEGKGFLERAVNIRPESGPAHRFLGECYQAVDMKDKAITAFTRAVKINPNDAAALSALGCLYETLGKELEIATMFCQQSIRIEPEEGLYRHRLGRLYLRQNRLEEALKQFNIAAAMGYDSTEHIDQVQTRLSAKAS